MKWDCESEITQEEKEWLRRVMEDPNVELDFFKDLELNIPPPEYFMMDRTPMVPRRWLVYAGVAGTAVGAMAGAIISLIWF